MTPLAHLFGVPCACEAAHRVLEGTDDTSGSSLPSGRSSLVCGARRIHISPFLTVLLVLTPLRRLAITIRWMNMSVGDRYKHHLHTPLYQRPSVRV